MPTPASAVVEAIVRLPQPVIAKIRGVATAAGLELVAAADLAIAESGARFATPGVNIGLWCLTPQVPLSRTVHPKHAFELLATGKTLRRRARRPHRPRQPRGAAG